MERQRKLNKEEKSFNKMHLNELKAKLLKNKILHLIT